MFKIVRIFKNAGFSLIIIALACLVSHAFTVFSALDDQKLSIPLMALNEKDEVKIVNHGQFINAHYGNYEFKPTLKQAIILSGNGINDTAAHALFCLILGLLFLFIAYYRPNQIVYLNEYQLWQFVGAAGILFLLIKFIAFFMVNRYVEELTRGSFKYRNFNSSDTNVSVLALVVVLTIILELLTYSRTLQEENDLTI